MLGKQERQELLILEEALLIEHVGGLLVVMEVNRLKESLSLIARCRVKSDRAIIFYSCGKDSILMLDLASKIFDKITLVFMYFVKDLEHIEKYLSYAKLKYPKIEIIRIPHWNLSFIYNTGTYCIESKKTKLITLSDTISWANNCYPNSVIFLGMKKSDSLNRNLMLRNIKDYYVDKTNVCYPIDSWKNNEVASYIKLKNLSTPIKYSLNKKSQGLGFNEDVFVFLRNNYPKDLDKIYSKFPLSEQILFEYDRKNKIPNIE